MSPESMDTQAQPVPTELESFVNELIDQRLEQEKQTLDSKDREALQKMLIDQLGVFILESVYAELPKEQQVTFKKLIEEKKTIGELRQYAMDHITNYADFMADVMLDFEDAYLAGDIGQGELLSFIDTLIAKKHPAILTPEEREAMQKEAFGQLDSFILQRTADTLSEEDAAYFRTMVSEKQSPQEIQQFARKHISDYALFMKKLLTDFQKEYLT